MLTAYDYPMAHAIEGAGIDMILVGDSVANVVLGLESTKDVTMDQMVYHACAVRRGAPHTFLIGDMPFEAYQKDARKKCRKMRRVLSTKPGVTLSSLNGLTARSKPQSWWSNRGSLLWGMWV